MPSPRNCGLSRRPPASRVGSLHNARRTQAHRSHGPRLNCAVSGPGRAPMKFPTPCQWRTSISFREPLLIDQYLPALAFHLSGTSDLRPSRSKHATRRLQGFHHGGPASSACPVRCGRAPAGTVMDGRRRAYHKIRLLAFAEPT
jgi:hypothetical protein